PRPPAGRDGRRATVTDHVGVFRQRQHGMNYVGLKTPVGRVTSGHLLELARLAEIYGRGELRLTPAQNVLIPHVADIRLGALLKEPLLKELPYNPSEIRRGLSACTGTDFCNLALIDTKTRALELAGEFDARMAKTRPLTVRWSGCPAGCGNHHTADVGLQGCKVKVDGKIVDGVHVFVGGRGGAQPRAGVRGFVSFIGAGPGDPDLITVKALRRLREAEVIVHDRLVPEALLDEVAAGAEIIDVGKAPRRHCIGQSEINWLLVDRARRRRNVARLKGGDPAIFGRLAEEIAAVRAAGVPFEIIPGVTAATAAAALAGISLTERGAASMVVLATGTDHSGQLPATLDWDLLARADATLVFYMAVQGLPTITAALTAL